MLAWLRPRPWPPRLGPDEVVILEGKPPTGSFWARLVGFVILLIPLGLAISAAVKWIAHQLNPVAGTDSDADLGIIIMILLMYPLYWKNHQDGRWMLTNRRLVSARGEEVTRDEIGKLERTTFGGWVVHRAGPDQLLRGPKVLLDYVGDPSVLHDALERLK